MLHTAESQHDATVLLPPPAARLPVGRAAVAVPTQTAAGTYAGRSFFWVLCKRKTHKITSKSSRLRQAELDIDSEKSRNSFCCEHSGCGMMWAVHYGTMLCDVMLCYVLRWCTMPCNVMRCGAVSCHTVLCGASFKSESCDASMHGCADV